MIIRWTTAVFCNLVGIVAAVGAGAAHATQGAGVELLGGVSSMAHALALLLVAGSEKS